MILALLLLFWGPISDGLARLRGRAPAVPKAAE
jgi:hypothetical protein